MATQAPSQAIRLADTDDVDEPDVTPWVKLRPHFTKADKGLSIGARIPDDLVRMIDKLLSKEEVPYQTRSDFLRDACWALAQAIQHMLEIDDPALLSAIRMEQARAAAEDLEHKEQQAHETVEKQMRAVMKLWGYGQQDAAVYQLNQLLTVIRGVPIAHDRMFYTRRFRGEEGWVQFVKRGLEDGLKLDTGWKVLVGGGEIGEE